MESKYSDCFYCGGAVAQKRQPREVRWKGELLIFEDVPMGVCAQCGERVLKPGVAKAIDRTLAAGREPVRTMTVPVYRYEVSLA